MIYVAFCYKHILLFNRDHFANCTSSKAEFFCVKRRRTKGLKKNEHKIYQIFDLAYLQLLVVLVIPADRAVDAASMERILAKHYTPKESQYASEYRTNLRGIKKSELRLVMCVRLS